MTAPASPPSAGSISSMMRIIKPTRTSRKAFSTLSRSRGPEQEQSVSYGINGIM